MLSGLRDARRAVSAVPQVSGQAPCLGSRVLVAATGCTASCGAVSGSHAGTTDRDAGGGVTAKSGPATIAG